MLPSNVRIELLEIKTLIFLGFSPVCEKHETKSWVHSVIENTIYVNIPLCIIFIYYREQTSNVVLFMNSYKSRRELTRRWCISRHTGWRLTEKKSCDFYNIPALYAFLRWHNDNCESQGSKLDTCLVYTESVLSMPDILFQSSVLPIGSWHCHT